MKLAKAFLVSMLFLSAWVLIGTLNGFDEWDNAYAYAAAGLVLTIAFFISIHHHCSGNNNATEELPCLTVEEIAIASEEFVHLHSSECYSIFPPLAVETIIRYLNVIEEGETRHVNLLDTGSFPITFHVVEDKRWVPIRYFKIAE